MKSHGKDGQPRRGGEGDGKGRRQGEEPKRRDDGRKRISENFVLPGVEDRRIKSKLVNKSFEKEGRGGSGSEAKTNKKKEISAEKLERFMGTKLGQALAKYLSDSEDENEEGNK